MSPEAKPLQCLGSYVLNPSGIQRLVFEWGEGHPVSGKLEAPKPTGAEDIEAAEQAGKGRGKNIPEELKEQHAAAMAKGEKDVAGARRELPDMVALPKVDKTLAFLKDKGISEKALTDYLKDQKLLSDKTYVPTPSQMLEAIRGLQERTGFTGKDLDGVIGNKTYAKMEAIPDLIATLKGASEKEPLFQTVIAKGTTYRYRDASGQRQRAHLGADTSAVVLKETPQQYVAKISIDGGKDITVEIPKNPLPNINVALTKLSTGEGMRGETVPAGRAVASGGGPEEKPKIRSHFEEENERLEAQIRKGRGEK